MVRKAGDVTVVVAMDIEEAEVTMVYGCKTGVDSWKLVEVGGDGGWPLLGYGCCQVV